NPVSNTYLMGISIDKNVLNSKKRNEVVPKICTSLRGRKFNVLSTLYLTNILQSNFIYDHGGSKLICP
ncbi:MAG TPA: hypothetical protein PK951_13500, partial [Chitinophagaceae bacterium]|nr:hypothetical protein [Chitinophagaceae bacterium]